MQNISRNGNDLFSIGRERLHWLQERQQTLAGNIANADTPNFHAKDISPFESALQKFDITPTTTHLNHISTQTDFSTHEINTESSLNGNQVSIEEQMEEVAKVNDQQHFAVNLYSKYMNMFENVLGR